MPKIIVGRSIKIEKPHAELLKAIKNELNIVNPAYLQLEAMGKNTFGNPRHYQAFKRVGDDYIIPFGAVSNKVILKNLIGYSFEIIDHEKHPIYLKSRVPMFDYQQKAHDYVINKKLHRGIIVGGTGSGKTNIGLEIIRSIGLRALWVTHTSDLLNQSRERAKDLFGNIDIGYITAGKVEIGKDITFATVQTLVNVIDEVRDLFNVVIVDEAHHCVGTPSLLTMFYKVMNNIHAEYKFGLTATPKRPDGLEQMTYALLGDICYEVPQEDIKARVLPIKYHFIYNDKDYEINDFTNSAGMIDPHKLTEMLNNDIERNALIVDEIEIIEKSSNGILVLSKRVAHCELLYEMCVKRGLKTAIITGNKITGKQRKEILASDDIKVLIATNSLAKEGLDLVRYDSLILTYNVKQKTEFTQASGRVRRVDGTRKKFGHVYEICDSRIAFLSRRCLTHERWSKTL